MSRGQRVGLIALAVAVAAVAFVIARPDEEDDKAAAPSTSTEQATDERTSTAERPTATTETRPEQRIELQDGKPVGGVRRIEATKGEFVRITVESDTADELHLHGYDVTRAVAPGEPARLAFRAEIEGIFELESHEGGQPVARVVVKPA